MSSRTPHPAEIASSLNSAFQMFLESSSGLQHQHEELQRQINRLSADLHLANRRLREQIDEKAEMAEKLGALLAALPAGVVLVEDNIVTEFNPTAAKILSEIELGATWKLPEAWTKTDVIEEYRAADESGERFIQVRDASDALGRRHIIQLLDVTENVQTRERMERETKLAAMGRMAAEIAHQLRTPLATATLYAGHLCNESTTMDDRRKFSDRLRSQLVHLEQLASSMLGFLRQRPKNPEVVAIPDMLQQAAQTIQPLFEERGVILEVVVRGKNHLVTINRHQIQAALVAILENALGVSPEGSKVRMASRIVGQHVELTIEDEGPGIHPDVISRLFEPFSTTRSTGTGLGLSIARSAIESHRGEIAAGNRPTGGAWFKLTMPCLKAL
jgi:two-component system sensor histidine kinase FlrB